MLTAKAAHNSKMEGLQAGADEYLTKPFHLDELETRIKNLISLQQKIREHLRSQALPSDPLTVPHVNDVFLKQLNRIVDEKIDDPQLDVDHLARSFAMSRSTLNRKLNAVVGVSANEFIRTYRLQKATSFLVAGHDITSTAYSVGFNTASYFSECFKQQYGKSPSEFVASAGV
jgi:AraC-like DNA-binding protein